MRHFISCHVSNKGSHKCALKLYLTQPFVRRRSKSLEMKIVLLAKKSKEKRMKVRVSAKFRHKELSELCQHNFDIDLC